MSLYSSAGLTDVLGRDDKVMSQVTWCVPNRKDGIAAVLLHHIPISIQKQSDLVSAVGDSCGCGHGCRFRFDRLVLGNLFHAGRA